MVTTLGGRQPRLLPMHRTRLTLVAPFLLIGLLIGLLAGCGSDEADDDGEDRPAPTATASADADGPTVDAGTVGTDDFSFTPPDGWRDAAGEVPGFAPEVLFVEPTQGPFATNVNVIRSTGALDLSADEVVSQGFAELESVGFTGMAEGDPYEVDGETASPLRHGTEARLAEFGVAHGPATGAADSLRKNGPGAQKLDHLGQRVGGQRIGHFGLSQIKFGSFIDDSPDHARYLRLVNIEHRRSA